MQVQAQVKAQVKVKVNGRREAQRWSRIRSEGFPQMMGLAAAFDVSRQCPPVLRWRVQQVSWGKGRALARAKRRAARQFEFRGYCGKLGRLTDQKAGLHAHG